MRDYHIKIDHYYTPADLAKRMVWAIEKKQRGYIADFACGRGQLLSIAHKRWPRSKIVATDICRSTIASLRRKSNWIIGLCDFTSDSSRNRCIALKDIRGKVSLVLLNPPFSCRSSSVVKTTVGGRDIHSSISLAFVLNSTQCLTKNGQIVAILPYGCLDNEKDKTAWTYLQQIGKVEIIGTNGHKTFAGCSARTVIMKFRKGVITKSENKVQQVHHRHINYFKNKVSASMRDIKVSLIRGNISMFKGNGENKSNKSIPLVHSTELQNGRILAAKYTTEIVHKQISGPIILLPRVGKPNKSKIVFHKNGNPFVISDCVLAIKSSNIRVTRKVYQTLLEHWSLIEDRYTGTCARHIPLKTLAELLKALGFQVN